MSLFLKKHYMDGGTVDLVVGDSGAGEGTLDVNLKTYLRSLTSHICKF
jgi:hypothetical protein